MRSIPFSLFLFLFAVSVSTTQVVKSDGPKPQFEVATVRPNNSGETTASLGPRRGGRLNGTNQTARNLIRNAFNLQPYQMIGGPGWMDSDRFDIVAKAADADLDAKGMMSSPQFMLRLQALLEDRFELVAHWETRELPVYAIVVAADGKLGPKLRAHAGDCDRARIAGTPPTSGCGTRTSVTPTGGQMTGVGISMQTFARNLSGAAGRNVIDKTGLPGGYDFELAFVPDQSADTTGPSLFTAMQEQLGLKLEPGREPIQVLVIDRAERPAAD